MKFSGKISSLINLLVLSGFLICSYNGYSKKLEQPAVQKEANKSNPDKESNDTEVISVEIEGTISVFDVDFKNNIVVPSIKVEFFEFLNSNLLPLVIGGKTHFLETLFSRILPINAP